jgi:hypothetical protein
MNYKIGDVVLLMTLEEARENFMTASDSPNRYYYKKSGTFNSFTINSAMKTSLGKECKILDISSTLSRFLIECDETTYWWPFVIIKESDFFTAIYNIKEEIGL